MEFTCGKQVFSDALSKLQSVIPKKAILPILSFIRVESSGQDLRLTATNLENTIYSFVSDKMLAVTDGGVMCVPAKQLFDIARLMPDGPIKVTSDANDWVHILGRGSRFKIPGFNPIQFPELPDYNGLTWIDLPAKRLEDMLSGVKYARTEGESLMHLEGVQLEIHGDTALTVATDGQRISLSSTKLPAPTPNDFEVFIPSDGLNELIKMAASTPATESISVGVNKNLFFKSSSQVLAARLMVTKFPSYAMPFQECGTYPKFCNFRADSLIPPIKRAMLSANKKDSSLALDFSGGNLRIKAADADLGEAEEVVESNFNGGEFSVSINGKFLLDYLEPVGPGNVKLEVKNNTSQLYFSGTRDDVDFFYCLMPMR